MPGGSPSFPSSSFGTHLFWKLRFSALNEVQNCNLQKRPDEAELRNEAEL